jgi:hypothetical protein
MNSTEIGMASARRGDTTEVRAAAAAATDTDTVST